MPFLRVGNSDAVAGVQPLDLPGFVPAQAAGGLAVLALMSWLSRSAPALDLPARSEGSA